MSGYARELTTGGETAEDCSPRMKKSDRNSASTLPSMRARSRISGSARSSGRGSWLSPRAYVLMGSSSGLDESIRQDVAALKAWSFLPPQAKVVGYAFEVETGRVREVVGL